SVLTRNGCSVTASAVPAQRRMLMARTRDMPRTKYNMTDRRSRVTDHFQPRQVEPRQIFIVTDQRERSVNCGGCDPGVAGLKTTPRRARLGHDMCSDSRQLVLIWNYHELPSESFHRSPLRYSPSILLGPQIQLSNGLKANRKGLISKQRLVQREES